MKTETIKTASHTPGPWVSVKRGADCNFIINIVPVGKRGSIANVIDFGCTEQANHYIEENKEQTANAKLMAAAPDLLTSAQQALEALSCTCSSAKPAPAAFCDCFTCEAAKALQAAIAKATQ